MILFLLRTCPGGRHLLSAGIYNRAGWRVLLLYVLNRRHAFAIPLPVRALEVRR